MYSSGAPAPSKKGGLLWAAAVTGGVLVGGYMYSSQKKDSVEVSPVQKSTSAPPSALNPNEFVPFKLAEIQEVSHNTSIYRFSLKPDQVSGMTVASCLLTMKPAQNEGEKPVVRPYTPTSPENAKGYMDLIIKRYPDGVMSNYVDSLKVGDDLLIKGPIVKYQYTPNMKKEIGMIAGGTGITPMLQVISKIAENPEDKTKVSLLFANVTEDDILLRNKLDQLQKDHPDQIKISYTLDKPPKNWSGESGFVTPEMAKKYMPDPSLGDDTVVFVCGPPGMMAAVSGKKTGPTTQGELSGALKKLGFTESNVFKF
ncbi:NADH-cytochrome b5 reductase-like protein [Smittium mucronatum]|uniref:NADH-cytochrome b5 reductase n=1 Tax=Smittium mucronatum TaxID=133383 RepID=A0A1R0GRS0_9FUNG|nr:NADH-cytochrome b5 reductase-like protein [Smittium mucronatum]